MILSIFCSNFQQNSQMRSSNDDLLDDDDEPASARDSKKDGKPCKFS